MTSNEHLPPIINWSTPIL